MDENLHSKQRELLSYNCFEMLAHDEGYIAQKVDGSKDYAKFDYAVFAPFGADPKGSRRLEVQIKGPWETSIRTVDGKFKYAVESDLYNWLAVPNPIVLRALVVVSFPRVERWVELTDKEVVLSCIPYFIDLAGNDDTQNASRHDVEFDASDRFTSDTIGSCFRTQEGE